MRLLFFSLCWLGTIHACWAQLPYQLFRSEVQYLYSHPLPVSEYTSPILGVKLSASACQTTYESLQPNMAEQDPDCLVRVSAFIGSEVCREGNLTLLNLRSDEDPYWLTLQTQSPLGYSWMAATGASDTIYARVDNLEWTSVLGLLDSVKTIGLYTRNNDGILVSLYEEAPLMISRSYGLVMAPFLHWLGADVGLVNLVGMSNPAVGIQNPERASVFTLEPSDELHLKYVNTTVTETSFFHTHREEQATLVERWWTNTNGEPKLNYSFLSDQKIYQEGPDASMDTVFLTDQLDTFVINWNELDYLDNQPGSLISMDGMQDSWRTLTLGSSSYCDQQAKRLGAAIFIPGDACGVVLLDASPGPSFYRLFAGPYFQEVTLGGLNYRLLQYANLSDGHTCGTPFEDVVANEEVTTDTTIRIWPNPASSSIRIAWPESYTQTVSIELLDAGGQLLLRQHHHNNGETLNINKLPAGLYFIRYTLDSRKWQYQKLIKN